MARITISLSDDRHRALKEAAVRQGKTIGRLVEESLELYGVRSVESAAQLVARARRNAGLSEQDALEVALEEARAVRSS
ncbi:MAG: CopG family transcriptional regulator [Acidobacteria bacterium]|nr:CopG family transcriptional regulator [Acidobacteriota bacterium]